MQQANPLSFLLVSERAEEIKRITPRMRGFYPGCRVEAVYTAEEAMEWVSTRTCDAVLLDERLSGLSGLEILPELRRRTANAAILVLTEHYDAMVSVHLLQAGADHVLSQHSPAYLAELPVVTGAMLAQRDRLARLDLADKRAGFLLESINDIIYELDPEGRFVSLSPGVASLLGHRAEELIGAPYSTILAAQDRDRGERRVNERRTGARATRCLALRLAAKTGASPQAETVPVECSATGLYSARSPSRFLGTLGVLGRTATGDPSQRVSSQPLTERSWQEKVETVRLLAGRIAHDFNNMLTVITGYGQLMLKTCAPNDPQRRRAEEIAKAGERAADLTRQLLAFSRRDVPQEVLNLNAVIADMEPAIRQMIGRDIQLTLRLPAAMGYIKAAPVQLRELLQQLTINAREAMPNGGRLTIAIDRLESDKVQADCLVGVLQPGPYVRLTVSDTGTGMDPETQTRLSEPFFTSKEGKWLGLGLAMAYGIIAESGASLRVVSAPREGATFMVYWPRANEKALSTESPPAPSPLPHGTETVLLVEDEMPIRSLVRTVLEEQGYRVIEAVDADEAARLSEEHRGPIHLLLTDIVMPGMNGHELASRLGSLYPDMKILFMSGYTGGTVVRSIPQNAAFIQKPFTPEALEQKLREVLNKPS